MLTLFGQRIYQFIFFTFFFYRASMVEHIEERGIDRPHGSRMRESHRGRVRPKNTSCTQSPYSEMGPFFLSNVPNRWDIRDAKNGIPLKVKLKVIHYFTCRPIENATVFIWHCDSDGAYSGFSGSQVTKCAAKRGHCEPVDKLRFLRGYQITNSKGWVRFYSIMPGWIPGRTMHINVLIMFENRDVYAGELYFTEEVASLVASNKPYSISRTIRINNNQDLNYNRYNGSRNVLTLQGGTRGINGVIALAVEV